MNNYRQLTEQVQNHIQSLFKAQNHPQLLYHNLVHTSQVVAAATQIANHYGLSDKEFFTVIAAAWFHDVGYLKEPEGHEVRGAGEAIDYLTSLQVDHSISEAVSGCILATKMPQHPQNLCEQILCDADLFHLGTDEFWENTKLLRKEYDTLYHTRISKEDWRAKTIVMMQEHHYHTDYCRQLLNAKKEENIVSLIDRQKEKPAAKEEKQPEAKTASGDNEKKLKKDDRPDKGIETMFRISSSNHQRLSDMADNKSHIMITVNSIIISVVASLLLRKLDTNDYLIIPAILLLLISLVTIVISILATRPNIPNGTFSQQDLDEKKVNLLFFGNFYRMSLDSYAQGMQRVMNDRDFLYGTLIRDIYAQGVVLGKKYKLLRLAYNIFMFGLIVSVIAFIVAALMENIFIR